MLRAVRTIRSSPSESSGVSIGRAAPAAMHRSCSDASREGRAAPCGQRRVRITHGRPEGEEADVEMRSYISLRPRSHRCRARRSSRDGLSSPVLEYFGRSQLSRTYGHGRSRLHVDGRSVRTKLARASGGRRGRGTEDGWAGTGLGRVMPPKHRRSSVGPAHEQLPFPNQF